MPDAVPEATAPDAAEAAEPDAAPGAVVRLGLLAVQALFFPRSDYACPADLPGQPVRALHRAKAQLTRSNSPSHLLRRGLCSQGEETAQFSYFSFRLKRSGRRGMRLINVS